MSINLEFFGVFAMSKKNLLPYISVVLSAYNRDTFLTSALESLTNQDLDCSNFEVILLTNFDIGVSLLQEFKNRGGNLKMYE